MGLEPTSPHRTERCKSLSTAVCTALDSPARGGGAGSERAPGPAGRGQEELRWAPCGPSHPRAWASAPGALLGAPRRGRSPRWGQALAPPCGGLGTAWPSPGPGAGRTLGLQPSGRFFDSEAGRGRSPRTEPGRAATTGQLFMGRLGVLPRPALPSPPPGKWGEDRGKVPRAKLATFLIFPK